MSAKAKEVFLCVGIVTALLAACLGLETRHDNHLGWVLLFSGMAFIAIGCIYLGMFFVQEEKVPISRGRSLWLPSAGILLICLVTPLEYLCMPPFLPRVDLSQDIGLILFAGGLAFYLLSLRSASLWNVPTEQAFFGGSRFVSTLQFMLRCPTTASLLLFGVALSIGYSSLLGLLVFLLIVLPGLTLWVYKNNPRIGPIV